jgi:hypothetical protein
MNHLFICQCLVETLDGVRDGLSHFSGPSRVALLFAVAPDDPMRILDPQNLLRGHEPKFKELYLDTDNWRGPLPSTAGRQARGSMLPEENLGLAGLISQGGRFSAVAYQMWFTEHHPDMCSIGPTERWLEHAAFRLAHDLAHESGMYTGISGSFLREYATHAVRDYLVDELNVMLGMDTRIRIYPVLDTLLSILQTREEGAWPRGRLVIVEKIYQDRLGFVARFPRMDRPSLENVKHVRKLLLAVEDSDRQLVSDGKEIVGIAAGPLPAFAIVADFQGGHGFLRLQDRLVCSLSNGSYKSTTRQANLVQLEEALLESALDSDTGSQLLRIVAALVQGIQNEKHGTTLIIDLSPEPVNVSGQQLAHPLDLRDERLLELATSLAKVDGALHIGDDLHLHGFACLLDGRAIAGEDRSRGARFNSALRFSSEHPDLIVVVVSSDRPVSVIQAGVQISAQCHWTPIATCLMLPPTLQEWIDAENGT